ncbi:MAG TPA: hypothetical protein DIT58_06130 [Porticoccaceae bacterium]|nr:hypothetical protein [Porticoccaceae bacterium]
MGCSQGGPQPWVTHRKIERELGGKKNMTSPQEIIRDLATLQKSIMCNVLLKDSRSHAYRYQNIIED